MMKIPSLLRAATKPLFRSLIPSSSAATFSVLQRVKLDENIVKESVKVEPKSIEMLTMKQDALVKSMLLQQIIKKEQNVNNLITSIQSLKIKQVQEDVGDVQHEDYQSMNRSARHPRRANRGKRPVCRQARRAKRRRWGNHRR